MNKEQFIRQLLRDQAKRKREKVQAAKAKEAIVIGCVIAGVEKMQKKVRRY